MPWTCAHATETLLQTCAKVAERTDLGWRAADGYSSPHRRPKIRASYVRPQRPLTRVRGLHHLGLRSYAPSSPSRGSA